MAEPSDKSESQNGKEGRLPPAAERALAEAAERRKKAAAQEGGRQKEIGGRGGKDPARYGDWEVEGLAKDF